MDSICVSTLQPIIEEPVVRESSPPSGFEEASPPSGFEEAIEMVIETLTSSQTPAVLLAAAASMNMMSSMGPMPLTMASGAPPGNAQWLTHGPLLLDRSVCLPLFAMWPSFVYFSTVI